MIRGLRYIFWVFVLGLLIGSFACSERVSDPVILPDSTFFYPSITAEGISAKITFSSRLSQKTGRQSAISDVFTLKEEEYVYALIDLENRMNNLPGEMMFHIDWTDPGNRSVFLKRIDLLPGDSLSALSSSLSISPEKRQPGEYLLRVYLFRELIAEKRFILCNEQEMKKVTAGIIFYKSLDDETGMLKGVDTVFSIRKKGILRARIELANLDVYKDAELPLRLEWTGPDGKDFYSKKIDLLKADSISVINSSISITPDKREPGEYFLRVYLFDDIIGEKEFVLEPSD